MSQIHQKIDQLRQHILSELELCSETDTPYICSTIKDPKEKEKIVLSIIEMVGNSALTISQSISQLEWRLNPNNVE